MFICSLSLMVIALTSNSGYVNIKATPIWEEVYETPNEERPMQLVSASDGGYILVGSYLIGGTDQTSWILKVDSEGKEEWNQSYSHPTKPQCHIRSVAPTSDGGYVVNGFGFGTEYSTWDLWILKIDENGTEEWNRTYNGKEDGPDYGSQIVVASDGGFLVAGATQSEFALPGETWNTDYWLIKTDVDGNEEWNKTYHRVGSDQASALIPLDDGNYLLSGLSKQSSESNSAFSIWVIKITENGNIVWDQAYDDGTDWYGAWERNILETADGGFLLTCYPFGDTYGIGKDYWIIKCDSNGNVEWNTTFGSNNYDTPSVCLQSTSGEYYIGGAYGSISGSEDKGDMCIVRVSDTGDILGFITYGEVTRGEKIVDMVLIEGSDSSMDIVALASVENGGSSPEYRDFWLGKFPKADEISDPITSTSTTTSDTSTLPTTTDKDSSFAGIIILTLSLTTWITYRRKKKAE